jgi:hypothetical protein
VKRRNAALTVGSIALLVALTTLLFSVRGTGDMKIWERWTSNALRLGVIEGFRENDNDYPPLSNVLLWATGHAGRAAGLPLATATKISLVGGLAISVILLYGWVRKVPIALRLWLVLVLNAVGMGYLDIYAVPPLLMSLWALQRSKPTATLTWFTVACLVKWQPLLIGPFLILHIGRDCWPPSAANAKRAAAWLAPSLALLLVAIAVFGPYPFFRAFAKSQGHRLLSGDTLNLPWIATWIYQGATQGWSALAAPVVGIASAPLWLRLPFKIVFAWQYLTLLWRYATGRADAERTLAYALVGFLAYVTISSGVHENHWFVPCVLALVLLQYGRHWLWPAVVVGAMANLNLWLFYGITGRGLEFSRVVGVDVSVPLAVVAIAIYVWMLRVVSRMDRERWAS